MESVNVWHGMPVKRVGWMTESGPLLPLVKYTLATSPFWAGGSAGVAAAHREHSGHGPAQERPSAAGRQGRDQAPGHALESGTKLIAWLPTYRYEWNNGRLRTHCSHVLGLAADAACTI